MKLINRQELLVYVTISTKEIILVIDKETTSFFRNGFHMFIYCDALFCSSNVVDTRSDAAECCTTRVRDAFCLIGNFPDVVGYLIYRKFGRTVICSDVNMTSAYASVLMSFRVFKTSPVFAPPQDTSNGSWRQGIKGEMTCTVYVALVWNIIYWIMMIITLFTE